MALVVSCLVPHLLFSIENHLCIYLSYLALFVIFQVFKSLKNIVRHMWTKISMTLKIDLWYVKYLCKIEEVVLSGLPQLLKSLEKLALPSATDRVLVELGRFCTKLKEIHFEVSACIIFLLGILVYFCCVYGFDCSCFRFLEIFW